MCGIVGYTGGREAAPLLLEGLQRLEYRGYDSAGLALVGGNGDGLVVRKLAGRVAGLVGQVAGQPAVGKTGIAHTRWATHGAPTERNAHPHVDCDGRIALVHNGIIENADALRAALEQAGHCLGTDTDTETLAHLIEDAEGESLEDRVIAALAHVEGTYGLAVVTADEPGKIVVARRGSPVLLGIGDGEFFVASDASAILEHTRSVVYLNDGDIAVLTPTGYHVIDSESHVQVRAVDDVAWDLEAIALGGYPHFMLKEICEQPETARSTLRGRVLFEDGAARLNGLNLAPQALAEIRRIVIVACGTSWHAGLVGRHIIEQLARLPVEVEYASGYRYRPQLGLPGTLTLAISQSGETADTLEAMRAARVAGSRVLGIVNVVGSTIAREAQGGIYLHAGPEIGVASTKAFTSQIVALALLGLFLGRQRGLSGGAGAGLPPGAAAGSGGPGARARAPGEASRTGVRRSTQLSVPRARGQLPGRARGRAQAEGDQLHSRRGLPRRGDEARAHRPDRRRHARSVRSPAGRGVPEGRVEHARGEGAGRADRSCHDRREWRPARSGRAPVPDSR